MFQAGFSCQLGFVSPCCSQFCLLRSCCGQATAAEKLRATWLISTKKSHLVVDPQVITSASFVRHVEWFGEIDSTNTYALGQHYSATELPRLIGAEVQTQGRGRGQNHWWSGTGSLTFSLVLMPEQWSVTRSQWPLMSLVTGLAICQALAPVLPGVDLRLKWPNDLYANGRKLCGILLETKPDHAGQVVIGVGLNVNNSLQAAPATIQGIATSLTDLTSTHHDRTQLLVSIFRMLACELTALGESDPGQVHRFRERCYLTGRIVTVREAGEGVTGSCIGIDDDGALRVLTDRGPRRILAGVVTLA